MPKRKKKRSFSIPNSKRFSRANVNNGIALGSVAEKYAPGMAVPLSLLSMLKNADESVRTAGVKIAIDHLTQKYLP
tara:strand:- start:815 stop:1042 length:228 start_codon:yes stop_codon:yes gene_type:complete